MTPVAEMEKPSEEDVFLAEESSRILASLVQHHDGSITLRVGDGEREARIPFRAFRLLLDILTHMGRGNPVSIIPHDAMLTTQQAADLLNVSRPFLVKLLETHQMPFEKVGTRRRVKCEDVVAYKRKIDDARSRVLDELANEAQEMGLYD